MSPFWRWQNKEEYARQKAGEILKRYPAGPPAEPVPERAPREPMAPLGPQPGPVQPRPSLLRPSTWPTTTGIPAGVGIAQTPWMQALMGAVGGPEAAQRAEPSVAWQRYLSSLTRERVAQPIAGMLQRGGPLQAVFDPEERRRLQTAWADVLAGRRMWGEAAKETTALNVEAWQQAPVSPVVRAAVETAWDPLGLGGTFVAAPFLGAAGIAGVAAKAYTAVDIADMAMYVASATPQELAGMALFAGGLKVAGLAAKTIAVGVPALRKLLASEVGAITPEGFRPEGKQRALASEVQELGLDQINIDPRKYQKRAIGKEGIGFREGRVNWILEHWDEALMTPVKVRRMPDGTFDLLGGHHRMEVLRRKGIGTVMAQIFDVDTPQAQHIARIDNMLVQGYEPSEWAAIVRGRADAGLSVAEVADEFGIKKPSTVAQYLSLSYLPDSLLQAVDVGLLPQRVAVALGEGAQKYNIGPSTLQQLWLREIKPSPREWTPTDVRTLFERIAPRAEAIEKQMGMFGELPGMEGQRDSLLTAMREMKSQVKELRLRKTRLAGVEREIYKDKRAGKAVSPRLEQAAGLLQQEIDAADAALRQIEQGQLDRVMAQARPPLEMRPEEVRPTARMERPTFLTPEEARPVFGREGLPRPVPEAAPEAMRPMEVPPEEAARLAREAQEAAGQRRLGAPEPEAPPVRAVAPEVAATGIRRTPMERVRVTDDIARLRAEISRATDPMDRVFSKKMLENALEAQRRGVEEFVRPVSRQPERGYDRVEIEGVSYDVPRAMRAEDVREAIKRGQVLEAPEAPEAPPVRAPEVVPPPREMRPTQVARLRPGVAPSAEPAVPPPAVGVAPAIPAGAAVPPAQAPVGAAVPPPTGAAVPLGPPVQPPLPGAGLPPPSPVTAPSTGPSRLPTVLSNLEITARMRQPDALRRMMTWAETNNVKPVSWVLRHIGIVGTDPPSEAFALWSFIKATGNTTAMAATADLRQYGDVQKLFRAKDMMVTFRGKKLPLLDILEGRHPEFPMTAEQTAFRDAGWALADDVLALVHGEGIFPPQLEFPEGQHFWPRDVLLRKLPNGTIEVGVPQASPGGKFLTALMKSEHPREFKTAAEGHTLGFEYANPTDSMEFIVQQAYRAIAGQRALDFITEFIPSRPGKKVRFGEVQLPGVPGRYFKATDLGGVRDMLYDTPLRLPEQAANAVNALNRIPRLFQTVFDLGPVMLQMFGTLTRYPKVWGESVWRAWRSGFDPASFAKFLAQEDHAATVRRYAPEGLILTGHELTEATRGFMGRLPVVGGAVRVGGRIFDNMLTAARILGLEATEYQIKSPTDSAELVRFWNVFTGVVESGAEGITRRQQALESALLYSPRLHRAAYSLLFDVAQGGLRGKMARRALGQFAAATFLGYLGLCGLLKQKPRLDPKEGSRWLTIQVGDQYMGIGGPLFMTLRTLAQIERDPDEAQDLAWRYVRGRLSPVVGTGIDVLKHRDALGMPIETLPQLTKRVIADNLTPIWIQGVVESGAKDWKEAIAVTSGELVGLRTFPVSPARKRDALREELAQASFRRPWAQLHRPQKYALEQSPDLKAATEAAQAMGRKREQPWALFWADVESQREPYKAEVAQLTTRFRSNQLSGNDYREQVQERQMIMARIPDMLRNTRAYKGIAFAKPAAQNPVDEFIDAYYQIADQARDPLTGMAEPREIVMQRQELAERTKSAVVQEAMPYINKNLDPQYVKARDQYYEYMRIPQYIGMSEEQAQAANEAMRKYSAMRRANPLISTDVTRSLLAQQDPRAVILMEMAYSRRNPARRMFWSMHPLLSVFYSDLTEEEVEMVAPRFMPQQQAAGLPSWAATPSTGRPAQPQPQLPAWAMSQLPGT